MRANYRRLSTVSEIALVMTTFERVKKVLVDELNVDPNLVTPGFSLRDQMDADSLDMVEILLCMEEAFDIRIEEQTAQRMNTVQDLVEHVEQQLEKQDKR